MEIVNKPIDELIPYENNPRINDNAVPLVAQSIKEFGFKNPIIIDKDSVVVAGHTRLKAAKQLKLTTVPCIIADDLTDQQIRAFRIIDNKTAEAAEWDLELLDIELEDIVDIDMTEYGFTLDDEEEQEPEEQEEDPFGDIDRLETHYGVPYQGNKSRIADIIISILPEGRRLVDLFGGVVQSRIVPCFRASGNHTFTTI